MTKTPTSGYLASLARTSQARAVGYVAGPVAVTAVQQSQEAAITKAEAKQPVPASRTMQEAFMGYSMGRAAGIAGGTSAVVASQAAVAHAAEKAEGVVGRPVGYTWLMPPQTPTERVSQVSPTQAAQQTIVERIVTVVHESTTGGAESGWGTPAGNGNGNGGGGDAWDDEEGLFTQRNLLIGGAAIAGIVGLAALSRRKSK